MLADSIKEFRVDPDFQAQFDAWKESVTKIVDTDGIIEKRLEIHGYETIPAMPREGVSVPRLLVFYRTADA